MNIGGGTLPHHSGEVPAAEAVRQHLERLGVGTPIILDGGANEGAWAQIASTIWPAGEIYAFEPAADTFERLVAATHSIPNVHPVQLGISHTSSVLTLFRAGGDSTAGGTSAIPGSHGNTNRSTVGQATFISLDEWAEKNTVETIHFLKLDIEGAEFHALQGAKRLLNARRIECVQFEYGLANVAAATPFQAFWDILSDTHTIYRILPTGLWKIPEWSIACEVPVCTNYLAIAKAGR